MTGREDVARLPCGTSVAVLVDQVAEGLPALDPAHQAACPDCRATLRELELVWGTVREVVREEVVPPSRLIENVLRRVRQELRALGQLVPLQTVIPRLVRHALLGGPRGATRIADSVVARIVAKTARDTPGVHALSVRGIALPRAGGPGRLTPRGVAIEVSGHSVSVEVRLVVAYGRSIPDLAAEVRRRVIHRVEAMTGLEPTAVAVAVDDVFGDPEPVPRRVPVPRAPERP
ncbi:MAG: Asp23/Gls24 family envelope stress response protein [Actinobacteria bacterium]|nr:Asp23/Gls24 family envelope stress response protein [Actinomycetota bacterium]